MFNYDASPQSLTTVSVSVLVLTLFIKKYSTHLRTLYKHLSTFTLCIPPQHQLSS